VASVVPVPTPAPLTIARATRIAPSQSRAADTGDHRKLRQSVLPMVWPHGSNSHTGPCVDRDVFPDCGGPSTNTA
jgi:hypothetical protein